MHTMEEGDVSIGLKANKGLASNPAFLVNRSYRDLPDMTRICLNYTLYRK